jgi:hypothetical protein
VAQQLFDRLDAAGLTLAGIERGHEINWAALLDHRMGFPNTNLSCPSNEKARTMLIEELRRDFAAAAAAHRLVGIDYFSWNSDPWSKQIDADSVYRCGAPTESGREAVKR